MALCDQNLRKHKIVLIVADIPGQLKEITWQRCAMSRLEV